MRVLLERVIPQASLYLHSMDVCVLVCVLDLRFCVSLVDKAGWTGASEFLWASSLW